MVYTYNRNHVDVDDVEGGVETPPDLLSPQFQKHANSADTTDTSPSASEGEERMFNYSQRSHHEDDADIPSSQASRCCSSKKWLLWAILVVIAIGAVIGVAVGVTAGAPPDEEMRATSSYEREQNNNQEEDASLPVTTPSVFSPPAEDGGVVVSEEQDRTDTVQDGSSSSVMDNNALYDDNTMAPTSEVFDIILSHSEFHGLEFQDPTSYQSKAAQWVEQTAILGEHSIQRLLQRYALACLYYATNAVQTMYTDEQFGAGNIRPWIDESGWLVDNDECNWYRIECDDAGYVTAIKLFQNRLTGNFPPEVSLLRDSLIEIDLFQNPIYNSGKDGLEWLGELTKLERLYYGRTFFEYPGIPAAIGKLNNLVEYDCSYSLHHGPLSGEVFAKLVNLEYLNIGGNSYFNSSIPMELAELPNLEFLYVDFSDIQGDLEFIPVMPSIKELWMDRNPLIEGTIPTEIGLADSLQSLSLTRLGLTGTIPTEMATLRLKQFWAYSNRLTGTIPTEFANVMTLKTLGLEGNDLVGSMPDGICMNTVAQGGLLERLDADCGEGDDIDCSCCTCCGEQCNGGK